MAFDLTGRVVLVIGGGRGIGAAIATRLAGAGARVAICNRTPEPAEELAFRLAAQGLSARTVAWPGTGRGEIREMVDGLAADEGRLDIAVHNAGGCPWASVDDLDEDKLGEALDINLSAFVWLVQACVPHMRAAGFGRLLVTSSVSARVAMSGGAHYSAAKAGVNAFVRGAAFEFARDGITVNGVEPGFIAKQGGSLLSDPERAARIARHIPLGELGRPEDVAHAMCFLASDAARYVTGQTIVVDGGSTLPESPFFAEDAP